MRLRANLSGERWLAVAAGYEELVTNPGGEHIVRLLEPGKLCLQVLHPLLETAHFREHAGIRPADVAE
jgi:hypothetical protein